MVCNLYVRETTRAHALERFGMAKVIRVEGFDAYKSEVEKNKDKTVFALFSGSKDANGASWCPDCVTGKYEIL